MSEDSYKRLAERLDALPNGYPPTEDGAELRVLECLFSPEEADLAAQLRNKLETPDVIAARLGVDLQELRGSLKTMLRKGLIKAGRAEGGFGYALMPFAIGIYEMQAGRLTKELALRFEEYYKHAFGTVLAIPPQVHRVIPVRESVKAGMEVRPYEGAYEIVDQGQAWGVTSCICREQKTKIGDPCGHPIDVCMVIHKKPNAYDGHPTIRSLTQDEAHGTLRKAAEAGLVHSVSNNQEGLWYICNCCSCSCGILRGMAELGIANVVASSPFVNKVDDDLCVGCELCIDACQFDALVMQDMIAVVDESRCVGCGVCTLECLDEALVLVRRPEEEILAVPVSEADWGMERAIARGIDLSVLE